MSENVCLPKEFSKEQKLSKWKKNTRQTVPQDLRAGTENLLAEAGWDCGAVTFQGKSAQPGRFGLESSGWAARVQRLTPFNQENLFIGP